MAIESATWVTPAGVELAWPIQLLRGMAGRGLPPVEIITRQVPQRAGTVRVSARHLERQIKLPLLLAGDVSAHRTLLRTWGAALNAVAGTGRLRFGLVDGTQREVEASVAGGLELDEQIGWMTLADITFLCHDPYFQDTADTVSSVSGGAPVASFFPLFPLVLSSSEIAAEIVITNDGDVETWPVISITGPATSPTIRNLTSSKVLTLSGSIGATETVTFDARPGARTVLRQDGTNLYPSLTTRQWFPLAVGTNRIRLEATGTTASTVVSIRYRRKWLTV